MLTSNGPFMIEIGARLGGDFISSYLTKASTGVSMDKAAIQIALGMKPNLKKVYNHFSMIKYIELDAGKFVDKLYPLERLKKNKGYVFSSYFIDIGDLIPKITHSAERPVCILFKSNNYNKLFELIDKSITEIKCGIKLK